VKAFLVTEKQELVEKRAEGRLWACEHCGCVIFLKEPANCRGGYWRECPAETGDHHARKEPGSGVYQYFWPLALI